MLKMRILLIGYQWQTSNFYQTWKKVGTPKENYVPYFISRVPEKTTYFFCDKNIRRPSSFVFLKYGSLYEAAPVT